MSIVKNNVPVVFWHSDPVGPNETVMLSGHRLGKGTKVELCQPDNNKNKKGKS